ncbi:MAG: calcium-binding protein [Desulfovibrionaceae bacterium]
MRKMMKVTAPRMGEIKSLSIKNFDKIETNFSLKDVQVEHGKNKMTTLHFKNGGVIKIEDFFNGENKIIEFTDDEIMTQYNVDKIILEQEYISLNMGGNNPESTLVSSERSEDFGEEILGVKTSGVQIQSSGGGYPLDDVVYEVVGGVGVLDPLDTMSSDITGKTSAYGRFIGDIQNIIDEEDGGDGGDGILPPRNSIEVIMQDKEWNSIKDPNNPSSDGQSNLFFSKVSIGILNIESIRVDIHEGIGGGKFYIDGFEFIPGKTHEIYNKDGVILYAEYSKNADGSGSIIITNMSGGIIDPQILESLLSSIQHYDEIIGKEYSASELFEQDTFHTGVISGNVSITNNNGQSFSQDIKVEFRKYIDIASQPGNVGEDGAGHSYYVKGSSGDDIIDMSSTGENANNLAIGGEGKDSIYGGDGNDFIVGDGSGSISNVNVGESNKDGDDVLVGGDGKDTILGGGGNDLIYGGNRDQTDTGSNILIGGSGNDTIYAGDKGDIVIGGSREDSMANTGNNLLIGGAGSDSVYGGGGNDTIIGGKGVGPKGDYIVGGNGNNFVFAGSIVLPEDGNYNSITVVDDTGNDTILTGSGNDYIVTGGGADKIYSGLGNDTIIVNGESQNTISANGGDNFIYANNNTGFIYTGSGNDTIIINGGNNVVVSGSGNDGIIASGATGLLDSGAGSDTISVKDCYDIMLLLREGDNIVTAENTSGHLFGDNGNNIITINKSTFDILLGSGNNAVNFSNSTVSLYAGEGNNKIFVSDSEGSIVSGSGANTIVLDGGIIKVDAAGGDNSISVLSGEMEIMTREGNDTIILSGGKSTVSSGGGDDYVEILADDQVVNTERGNDNVLIKSEYNSVITGDGSDTIVVHSNNNIIMPGEGDDSISLFGNTNKVDLIEGNNILTIEGSDNAIIGGIGNDTVIVNSGMSNTIETGYGEDSVIVNSSDNVINVGAGNDSVILHAGNNTVHLGTGADYFVGSSGNDSVIAIGDTVGDFIDLGMGDDYVIIQSGTNSTILGGSGRDTMEIVGNGKVMDRFDVEITDVEVLHFSNIKELELGGKNFSDMLIGNSVKHIEIKNTSGNDIEVFLDSSSKGCWKATSESNVYTYKVGDREYTITFGEGFTITMDKTHSDAEDMLLETVLSSEMLGFILDEEESIEVKDFGQERMAMSIAPAIGKTISIGDLLDNREDIVRVSSGSSHLEKGYGPIFEESTTPTGDLTETAFYNAGNTLSTMEMEAQLHGLVL